MADHVFEPELLSGLFSEDPGPDEVVLAVDRDLSNPLVELDDVTLVEASGGRVRAIGKGLDRYDGFDTGAFVCTPAVFEALRHAMLPKTYIKDLYPDLNLEWECYGWIERLLMDNGREFHALAVVDALLNLGIISEFSGSREPNDKPFIERFNRTFNYSFIHRLPGHDSRETGQANRL